MPRRTQLLEAIHLMNTHEICRESIRILLLHPTHFHSISILLFSPLSISLFLSHLLIHQYPKTSNPILNITHKLFQENGVHFLPQTTHILLSNSIFAFTICFPSSITFSLLGKAATIQAVANTYNGMNPSRERVLLTTRRNGFVWLRLVYTYICELLVIFVLNWFFVMVLDTMPRALFGKGVCSRAWCLWVVLGAFGAPFCFGYANAMIMGNVARVLAVLEGDCYGFKAMVRAKGLLKGRRQTALGMALLSTVGLRFVEGLFEFRVCRGIGLWEGPMLVSMYCMVLVMDTIMNVVFYYTCKPWLF